MLLDEPFQGKYTYHTHLPENHERPNSLNVLPMSRVMLGVEFFDLVNRRVSD